MENRSCYNCIYLSKRPGIGNYFIYKCSYWGIVSKKVLPQSIVISSIGKKCPFFKKKIKKVNKKNINNNINDDDLDIII